MQQEKNVKDLLVERLEQEMEQFQEGILQTEKETIYHLFYRIEVWERIYTILLGEVDQMKEETLLKLLLWQENLMETFYQGWMETEDKEYEQVQQYVRQQMKELTELTERQE